MPNKPVALVTSANQGIGLQIAKDLVPHGFTVLVGKTKRSRGDAVGHALYSGVRMIAIWLSDNVAMT
jgi:NAD(P)-dependent dehydrogenase (short-subunit alcohol dehydrogenase family)